MSSGALGIYGMVASATASSTFAGFATVAELWASLPGWPTPNDLFRDRPRCLRVEPVTAPRDKRSELEKLAVPTHAAVRFQEVDVDGLPAVYPTMAGIQQDGTRAIPFGSEEPIYKFVRDDGRVRPLYEIGDPAPGEALLTGDLIVRPGVGAVAIGPPSKFLTLWALLFCLSELARYYPDVWVSALDPDRSPAAVTLEHGLDLALEQAPALIKQALRGPIPEQMREEVQRRLDAASAATGKDAAEL